MLVWPLLARPPASSLLVRYLNALPALWFLNESGTVCSFLSPHPVLLHPSYHF